MDRPQAVLGGVCTSKMSNFQIWLVAPLGTVKFDGKSIGDGLMTEGWSPGKVKRGLYFKNVKYSNKVCDTSRNCEI